MRKRKKKRWVQIIHKDKTKQKIEKKKICRIIVWDIFDVIG